MRPRCAFIAALFLAARSAGADPEQALTVDPSRTTVSFHAQTTFHPFDGVAPGASGSVILREGRPAEGVVEVPVVRINTGSDARDGDMRGQTYLDAVKFPAIRFSFKTLEGPSVPAQGEASGVLKGTFEVKGVRKEISVSVRYGWVRDRLEVKGGFPLDIQDFGVPVPVVFVLQRMDPHIQVDFIISFAPKS